MPLFWVLLWSLIPQVCFSGPDRCIIQESSSFFQNESPSLKSLQCYNDYTSSIHCVWREHRNTSLQLWFKTDNSRERCVPYSEQDDGAEDRTVRCRYDTDAFAIGIKHTAFFLKDKTETFCSSVSHEPLDLSQHLRARAPVDLSTHDAGDGGWQLRWSSPYPSSSSLSTNITYQLSYRTDRQDNWTTMGVTNSSAKLERRMLRPGRRYEARVRARASVGQWSHWSPVVTWQTQQDAEQFPRLHCVLVGEKEVMCSWEVSEELAHFITHQLVCQHNQAAPSQTCCTNPTVTSDHSRMMLKYSCSLTVTDPEHVQLELLPTHAAKTFKANQHIRPDPPQEVNVREKGSNWMVEWTGPSAASLLRLCYQLCYYRTQDKECSVQNISRGSMSLAILQASLAPSQDYQVKVRSLVHPGEDSIYGGIPSEWTDPVGWTSHEATWSLDTLIYCSISAFVATVFLALYCTIPVCQRKVVLWMDSVPSPGKSKILSELKSAAAGRPIGQSENTFVCRVQHLDSVSTCSSDVSLWSTKNCEEKRLYEQDEGCWTCDNQSSRAEEVHGSGSSFMSFSGPYIFCPASEGSCRSKYVEKEDQEKETPADDSASRSPLNYTSYGKGYVCLPNPGVSRSTQDLVSCSDANTNTHRHHSAEQDQHHPDTTLCPDKSDVEPDLDEPPSSLQPSACISGPFTAWPQGVAIQALGYFQLPTAGVQRTNMQGRADQGGPAGIPS